MVLKKFIDNFMGHAEAGCSIFAISNHTVNPAFRNYLWQEFPNSSSAGLANNVADKKYFHGQCLPSVIRKPCFSDYRNLDLTWIGQFGLYFFDNITTEHSSIVVGYLFVFHKDADFSSCLNGKTFVHATE